MRTLLRGTAALVLATASSLAVAQSWPAKPVRIVVTLAPGSAADIVGRAVAEKLSPQLGQPVIVENRPGASTTIGAGVVAKADPDGYTLLVTTSSHTVAPAIVKGMPYDTARDLAGVAPLAVLPTLLVVPASRGWKTPQDLVAAAKAKPGSINYASAAAATQLNAERFKRSANFEAVFIPYKGAAEALTEVVAGRVDFYFTPIIAAVSLVRDGKLSALAIGGPKRSSLMPDLPTTLEAGYPNSDYTFWVGMFAPAKTPRDIVNRLHKESITALAAPETRERLAKLGADPMSMSPAEFDAMVREELKTNEALVKAAGITGN